MSRGRARSDVLAHRRLLPSKLDQLNHASVTFVVPPVTRNDAGHATSSALVADPVLGPGAAHAREHRALRARGGPGGGTGGRDARRSTDNARHPDAFRGRRLRAGRRGTDLPHRQGRVPDASASGGPRRDPRVVDVSGGTSRHPRPERLRHSSGRGRSMPTSDTVRLIRTARLELGRFVRPHGCSRTTMTTLTRRAFGLQDALRRAGSRPLPLRLVPYAAGSPACRNDRARSPHSRRTGPATPTGATDSGGRRSRHGHQSAPSIAAERAGGEGARGR